MHGLRTQISTIPSRKTPTIDLLYEQTSFGVLSKSSVKHDLLYYEIKFDFAVWFYTKNFDTMMSFMFNSNGFKYYKNVGGFSLSVFESCFIILLARSPVFLSYSKDKASDNNKYI